MANIQCYNSSTFLHHVNGKIPIIHSSIQTHNYTLQPFVKSMDQLGVSKGAQLALKFFHKSCNLDNKSSMAFQGRRLCNNHKVHNLFKDKFKLDATSTNNNPLETTIGFLDVLYRFSRPYAALGTALGAISTSLLAIENLADFSPLFFMRALQVNKPFLPIPAGELSMRTAIIVSSLSAILSFLMAWMGRSTPLFLGLFGWFFVGTAYSANVLPLLRWKRLPFTAAIYMLVARVFVVPPGYYMHIKNSIHGGSINVLPRSIFLAVGMFTVISLAIIFFKDITDIKGDEMHGIKSLASRLGPTRMFWSCIGVLEMAYVAAIVVGATSSFAWSKHITMIGHLVMGSILWIRAKSVDLKSMEAVQSMYIFLWQLSYVEYFLILFVR